MHARIKYSKDGDDDGEGCAHQKFKALAPEKVGHNKNAKLPMAKILQYPELRVNPFRDRICKVFSSSNDGDCTFEDFLDMMCIRFGEIIERRLVPIDLKLSDTEIQQLVQNVLDEADLDDDGALSFAEFEHIIDKSSDFLQVKITSKTTLLCIANFDIQYKLIITTLKGLFILLHCRELSLNREKKKSELEKRKFVRLVSSNVHDAPVTVSDQEKVDGNENVEKSILEDKEMMFTETLSLNCDN
ncbi:Calcium and integrin-binding protein 1 [Eumeta japonica]|uniref:Calcium and integrin-binding protein 1 n=1 Tax=Eumeta variegata TaxID=151549 RepID=A0A4C2AHZ5_EUMVA|nr:Calcium and integrin-binding protein 1 [Eumeta japonica]